MSDTNLQHSCGRSGSKWGIFEVSDCMACAVLIARSGARGGWTVAGLSRAMAEIRMNDRFTVVLAGRELERAI